jgi:uncharacterized membrane protein SpoIIM required for sporulation
MMTEDDFVAARRADWDALEVLLIRRPRLHRLEPSEIARAAGLYRALCSDLVRAESARYGRELTTFLDQLAARAHNALYAAPPYRWQAAVHLVLHDFPATLRKRARFLLVSALLFLVPGIIGVVGALRSPAFSAQVMSEQQMVEMEKAYSKGFEGGRDSDTNSTMAGFYVWNNVGIAFRCFATGILFGLGSIFFLLFNGLAIGTTFGAVAHAGYARNILTFCCGHAPFELTAIVISGAAGLQMGFALIDTGGRTRLGSLRAQAREIANLVIGAALMLGVAACIEGFWSPSSIAAPVKWTVAAVNAVLVTAYFLFVGRREPS